MPRTVVLGAGGMLGSMLAATISDAVAVDRSRFEAGRDDPGALLDETRCDQVVNAIGVIKPLIDEGDPQSVDRAMTINAWFPHSLAEAAEKRGVRVIHMTTDGVFSGRNGPYDEVAAHDADDVYGISKSRGEVVANHVVNLRCSIIGPERPPAARCSAGCWGRRPVRR